MSTSVSQGSSRFLSQRAITQLQFDNRNIRNLPVEENLSKKSRQVPNAIFSLAEPTPVVKPVLVAASANVLAGLLGLEPPHNSAEEDVLAEYFGGNKIIPGSRPAAHCYCGHQFGNFAGQLGDGATMYLGEVINPVTQKRWELQVKGAGKTPYSRTADGRKVLRSSVREFLCSEAMHHLGVPTTRAGTCVTSSTTVERDPMYDGGVIDEQCTIVSRIASNFFRFGSFEIFKGRDALGDYDGRAGPSAGNEALRKQLLDHILLYYPGIQSDASTTPYEAVYKEIVRRTAYLAAKWQCVGFVHGVLNTDNMSLMGLTIDYGPYGFMEHFDPQYVPNGSDTSARYSYQEQPAICKWNLGKLAEALGPLVRPAVVESVLNQYDDIYEHYYQSLMGAKFGFVTPEVDTSLALGTLLSKKRVNDELSPPAVPTGLLSKQDYLVVKVFFETLATTGGDFTDSFVALTEYVEAMSGGDESAENNNNTAQKITPVDPAALRAQLLDKLVSRCASPSSMVQSMRRKLKIHKLSMHPGQIEQLFAILQTATPAQLSHMFNGAPVDAIREEVSSEKRKLDLLMSASAAVKKYETTTPGAKSAIDRAAWSAWCETYTAHLAELCLTAENYAHRASIMRAQNPTFVLRSWLAQDAIALAEKSADYSGVRTLLQMLEQPYTPEYSTFLHEQSTLSCRIGTQNDSCGDDGLAELQRKYMGPSPEWADSLICTCSS
uniref:Selenoprotein O n=1 Tax=Spumella elongata TaxID=89044 RepID=A0A7S3GPP3_9STRA